MDRWTGVVEVSLNPNNAGPFFNVATTLLFSRSSKTLIAPSLNAIFFNGDRVRGTGDPVIERLSDSSHIAQLLVAKLGSSANAWVFDASSFKGPFAIYKEFIPAVNYIGDPQCYNPDGFPASSNIVKILSKCIELIRSLLSSSPTEPLADTLIPSTSPPPTTLPKTTLFGFSKGGIVVNQIIAELAHSSPASAGSSINNGKSSPESSNVVQDYICPTSKDGFLSSISDFHYVDVGLNSTGAYLTDNIVIGNAVENLLANHDRIRFVLHGTPRQWCDYQRPWIRKEKDMLLRLLEEEACRCEGNLQLECHLKWFSHLAEEVYRAQGIVKG